jgi:hypothetical protein
MADTSTRLIGNDGYIAQCAFGPEVVGDTTTPITIVKDKWVLITAKATSASKFGDLEIGDFYITSTDLTTNTTGDKWKVVTESKLQDLKGWSLEKTSAEIDVTVLEDDARVYRKGKDDASGSADFIYIQGVTDAVGGLANYFYDIVDISSAGVPTVGAKKVDDLYLIGYLNQGNYGDGTKIATIFKANFYSFPLNMGEDTAIEMSINFRLASGLKAKLYKIAPTA